MSCWKSLPVLCLAVLTCCSGPGDASGEASEERRPNILFAISDDQSWPHAGAYGHDWLQTPGFDRVARDGILFSQAFVTSPGCAPSRGSMVLGRYPWQNEHAGNHNTLWPAKYRTLPDRLAETGYHVGYTGKGVGPFWWALGGRYSNPAGPEYNEHRIEPPYRFISETDYARNFQAFLEEREGDQPFFFWYGATEPHRRYDPDSAAGGGRDIPPDAYPPFLPQREEVAADLSSYAVEIEWFDRHLVEMLRLLEQAGELEHTLIIVTSDNGMPFPAAKANAYEYGIHVPLAVSWKGRIEPGRHSEALVSLVDLAPTILEIIGETGGLELPMSGQSFAGLLLAGGGEGGGEGRSEILAGRERHSSARWANLGYPQRALRTKDYLYIRNFTPRRWPAGAPEKIGSGGSLEPGFHDLDWGPDWGGANRLFVESWNEGDPPERIRHALARRPAEELFDIRSDPGCLENLAGREEFQELLSELAGRLERQLRQTGDPRVTGADPDRFESHPRLAALRAFPEPDWAAEMEGQEREALIAYVGSDFSPLSRPEKWGEWGLEAGSWRLEKGEDGAWMLFDLLKDPEKSRNLSRMKPRLLNQLVSVYEFDWEGR